MTLVPYSCGKRVDANVVLAPFLGNRSTHLVHGGLGGVVCGAGQSLQKVHLLVCDFLIQSVARLTRLAI
jgi:hypothetical protein